MKVQMSSLNELENHVAQNLSCQIKTDLFWTKTFGCFCRLRKASVQDHFDTSQYQNVWIQRRLKWFSFAVYCLFWVCQREIKKHCLTWSLCSWGLRPLSYFAEIPSRHAQSEIISNNILFAWKNKHKNKHKNQNWHMTESDRQTLKMCKY